MSSLKFERLGLFPSEALVREMAVLRSLEVDWSGKVELLDDDARSEVEVVLDDVDKLLR